MGGQQLDAFPDCSRNSFGSFEDPLQAGHDMPGAGLDTCSEIEQRCEQEQSVWVSLANGEQLHLRHICPDHPDQNQAPDKASEDDTQMPLAGRSVFMLHGEAECGRIYYDGAQRGLASYLLDRGCEVFIADLGGRGRSLVPGGGVSQASVSELIGEALPALLHACAQHSEFRPGRGPDTWVAHGFGAVMLAAAWARMPQSQRVAQQWIFFAGRRHFGNSSRREALFTRLFCHPLFSRLVEWRNILPVTRMGLGSADENAAWYRHYARWMLSTEWLCEDGFDYRVALRDAAVPPTLHLATASDPVFCSLPDVRAFIDELGPHDARLHIVDRVSGAEQSRYSHLAMLLDPAAERDVFEPMADWMAEWKADAGETAASPSASPAKSPATLPATPPAAQPGSRVATASGSAGARKEVSVEPYYHVAATADCASAQPRKRAESAGRPRRGRTASQLAGLS